MNIIIATLRGTPSARGKRVAPLKKRSFPVNEHLCSPHFGGQKSPFSRCSASYARQGNQK